jgi:DNA polymerase IV
MSERMIIHLNVADFAVAVERAIDSSLCQRPLIVAPGGVARALVYDMSEEAYLEGVRKGMPLRQAIKRCRRAVIVPPRPERYCRAMAAYGKVAAAFSPLVEESGAGHLYVDATGTSRLFGNPRDMAWRIRRNARSELGLDPGWAVAPNKLLAKVATRVVKPAGEYIVPAGEENVFLAPQSVFLLPGLGRPEWERLRELNISLIGQLAVLSRPQLAITFGSRAGLLHDMARGIDQTPVMPAGPNPALRFDHRFAEDTNDKGEIETALYGLSEQAGSALRGAGLAVRRIGLRLEYADCRQLVRQATAATAVALDPELFRLARLALERAWLRRVRVRHLELICDRLAKPSPQLSLFAAIRVEQQRQQSLGRALDRIREQFGGDSIQAGRQIVSDQRPRDL